MAGRVPATYVAVHLLWFAGEKPTPIRAASGCGMTCMPGTSPGHDEITHDVPD